MINNNSRIYRGLSNCVSDPMLGQGDHINFSSKAGHF